MTTNQIKQSHVKSAPNQNSPIKKLQTKSVSYKQSHIKIQVNSHFGDLANFLATLLSNPARHDERVVAKTAGRNKAGSEHFSPMAQKVSRKIKTVLLNDL